MSWGSTALPYVHIFAFLNKIKEIIKKHHDKNKVTDSLKQDLIKSNNIHKSLTQDLVKSNKEIERYTKIENRIKEKFHHMRKFFDLDIDSIIEDELKDEIKEMEITKVMLQNKLTEYRKTRKFAEELFI